MAADVSSITYFAPIVAFLLVFLISTLVFFKLKLLSDNKWMAIFVSFLIAVLFVSFAGVRRYIEVIVPWFAVFLISLVFIVILISFSGKVPEGLQKGLGIVFVLGLLAAFVISGIMIFSDQLAPWLPGSIESMGNPVYDWLFSGPVFGAIILIILTIGVSRVLVKGK